ncbi:MAG: protein kinase [Planctomycetota bacterium]
MKEVGRGGMGVVYRARHLRLERIVALKVLTHGEAAGERQLERFRREAQAAARLSHPNLVPVFDAGQHLGQPYLVMDFVEGETLEQRLAQGGPFEPRVAAEIMGQVAEALAHAHEQALLHRDVKPANVILARDGKPRLTDFGLVKDLLRTSAMTQSGQLVGTPAYMSPEQAEGRGAYVDARADVYSLGATLYALLTGVPPFDAETEIQLFVQLTTKVPAAPSRKRPGVPADLDTVVLRCLEKHPGDRYASALEVRDELARVLRGDPILARPPRLLARAGRFARRHRRGLALTLVALVALLTVRGLVRAQRDRQQVRAAAERARATWARAQAGADDPLESGLAALQAAQQFSDVSGGTAEAEAALRVAAEHLGEVATATEQWGLAIQAYRTAAAHGGNPARVEAALLASQSDAAQRRDAVARQLEEVASGVAQERPHGLWEASFEIVRNLDPQALRLVLDELERLTRDLERARTAFLASANLLTPGERSAGEAELGDLSSALSRALAGEGRPEDRAPLEAARARIVRRARAEGRDGDYFALLAERQALALGPHGEATLQVLCRVLGHSRAPDAAGPALVRYLRTDADQTRAARAGIALCQLGDPAAAREALMRWPDAWVYRSALLPYLGSAGDGATPRTRGSREELLAAALEARTQLAFERASGLYEALLDRDPGDPDALLGLGTCHLHLGDPRASAATLKRIAEPGPLAAQVESLLGACAIHAHDAAIALGHFSRALAHDPTLESAHAGRVRSLLDLRRVPEARAAFDAALPHVPRERLRVVEGTLRFREGRLDEARRLANAALEATPDAVDALKLRAHIAQDLGDARLALSDLDRVLEVAPGDAFALAMRAAIYLHLLEQPARGVRDAERAVELGGDVYEVLLLLAQCLAANGELPRAVTVYERALQADRGRYEAYVGLANALDAAGERAREREVLEALTARFPQVSLGWINLGRHLLHAGDYAASERASRRALALQPSYQAEANLGIVLFRLGQLDEARAQFDQALSHAGPSPAPQLFAYRGQAYLAQGDLASARTDFERVIERQPQSALARGGLARIQALAGAPEPALAEFDALLAERAIPELLYWRGLTLVETNRLDQARGDLSRFVELTSPQDTRRARAEAVLAR